MDIDELRRWRGQTNAGHDAGHRIGKDDEATAFVYEVKAGEPKVEGSGLSSDVEKKITGLMARIFGQIPAAEIGKDGTFKGVKDIEGFTKRVADELDSGRQGHGAKGRSPTAGHPGRGQGVSGRRADARCAAGEIPGELRPRDGHLGRRGTGPQRLDGNAAHPFDERHAAGLSQYHAEFVLARWLPCAAGMPADGCVETSDGSDSRQGGAGDGGGKPRQGRQRQARLRGDHPFARGGRSGDAAAIRERGLEYSYLALADEKQRAVQIETERTQSRYQYRK